MDTNLEDDVMVDLDVLKARLTRSNKTGWLLEASSKTKLRTFVQIYNELEPKAIIQANLPRNHRSLLSKLKLGVLPLAIETGRWKDTPLELRTCKACDQGFLEDEYHFLLHCDAFVQTRTELFDELEKQAGELVERTNEGIVKWMLQKQNLRISGKYLEKMFMERKEILYVAQ